MRLADMHPQFVRYELTPDGWRYPHVATLAEAHGLRFDSPAGRGSCILVWFAVSGVPAEALPTPRWAVTGSCFDDLSVTPSINAIGDWHGWVTNGEIVSC